MKAMTFRRIRKWLAYKRGQGMTEYALILSAVAIFLVIAFKSFGLQLQNFFIAVGERIAESVR